MFRPAFPAFCISLSLVTSGLGPAPWPATYILASSRQSADEVALRAAVEQYYAAYAREDLDGIIKLWNGKSPDLSARKTALEKLFADNDRVETSEPATRKAKVEDERGTLRVAIEIKAIEAKTGKPASGLGKLDRSFHFVKEEGNWRIWREEATDEEVAAAFVAAKTEEERKALMAAEKEFLTEELTRVLYRQGARLRGQNRYIEAIELFRLSQIVSEYIGYKRGIASAQNGMGTAYHQSGDFIQALEVELNALRMSEELGDNRLLVVVLSNLGGTYREVGELALSLEASRRALKISRASNNQQLVADTLIQIGTTFRWQGNLAEAMMYFQQGLALSESVGYEIGVITALEFMGLVYLDQWNYDQAMEYQQKLLQRSETSGHKIAVAASYNGIGQVYLRRGDYEKALEYLQKSLKGYETSGNNRLIAQTLYKIGEAYFEQGSGGEALNYFQRSLKLLETTGDKYRTANVLNLIALARQSQGDHATALEAAAGAAAIARELGSRWQLFGARITAGQIHRALNQPELAQNAFLDAIAEAEALRLGVAGGEQEQQRFFEKATAPYYEMIGLLIAQNKVSEALSYAERAKARVLLDVLQNVRTGINKAMTAQEQGQDRKLRIEMASLNTQLQRETQSEKTDPTRTNEMKSRLQKARLSYEAFQTQLYGTHPQLRVQRGEVPSFKAEEATALLPDSNTALLEYAVTDDATYLFVLTRAANKTVADVKLYSIPVKRKELARLVESFRQKLASHNLLIREPATRVYELLLKPAQAQLKGKSHIVIVPDDVLWELPFQASATGAGRYFIEESAISYAPSLTVLREIVAGRNKRARRANETSSLLALGNPTPSKETIERVKFVRTDETLDPLPEAEREVKTLGQLYGTTQSTVFIGAEAREDRAKAEAGRFKVLHFATHGVLNNASPMYSHLVLSQGEGSEDGLLEAWELMSMDLKADLVVLSACETARGRVGAGEGMIGLSWALFVAGSPTTVVSQWKVDSASTSQLMLEFHRNYRASGSKAGGLRTAMLKLLRSNQYKHPFYWAPFVLIGDGY